MGKVPKPNSKHLDQIPARVRIAVYGWRGRPEITDAQIETAIRDALALEVRAAIFERNT